MGHKKKKKNRNKNKNKNKRQKQVHSNKTHNVAVAEESVSIVASEILSEDFEEKDDTSDDMIFESETLVDNEPENEVIDVEHTSDEIDEEIIGSDDAVAVATAVECKAENVSDIASADLLSKLSFLTAARLKLFAKIAVCCVAVLLLCLGIIVAFVLSVSRPLNLELGYKADFGRILDNKIISAFCKIENNNVDVNSIGEYSADLKFFGCIRREMTVNVKDTTAPTVEVYDVYVTLGTNVSADLFIKSIDDFTDTKVSFKEKAPKTSKNGKNKVDLLITDTSGNTEHKQVNLYVRGEAYTVDLEYGDETYVEKIKNIYPDVTDGEISHIKINEVGKYSVKFIRDKKHTVFAVNVNDTVPPAAEIKPFIARVNDNITAEDFVVSYVDKTDVKITFKSEPDISSVGVRDVCVILTDAYGNASEYNSQIAVVDIPEELTLEHGFTKYELKTEIFKNIGELSETVYLSTDFSSINVGENQLTLASDYGELTIKLTVTDNTAPVLKLKELRSYVGVDIVAKDFVQSCYDASNVEFHFVAEPNVSAVGSFPITIIAKDSSGNTTEAQTYLHIRKDTVPPVIYGVKNITVRTGGTVSYKSGVYAVDAVSGDVDVSVDTSKVNINEKGTYRIVYSATDASGNTATATAYVTVTGVSYDTIYAMADNILASITNSSMTQKQKAWAIYSWVCANFKYSTRTSYLMGNFVEGAYSGFTIRSGNCYIYYAVTSVLLTRAGIENIEIQRNDPSNPHYWNLVKIDGSWYHLDTCPHYAGHKITAFLLTDAEVKAYSKNEVANYYSFDPSKYPATP